MNCYECNSQMLVTKDQPYQYNTCGLDNIFISGIPKYTCTECNEVYVSIPKIKQLHRIIGMSLVCQEEKLLGKEIRFLRKEMRLKAVDFASLISLAPETLSRYENEHETPSNTTEKLIRTTFINITNGRQEEQVEVDWLQLMGRIANKPADKTKRRVFNPTEWLNKLAPECCADIFPCAV